MNGIPSDLRPSALDHGLGAFRALASLMPAGGLAAELICSIIPNQRIDRVVAFLEELQRRLDAFDSAPTLAEAEALSVAKAELFEAGVRSAARPIGGERTAQIAKAVAEGLSSDDLKAARLQRILILSDELSADDVIVLCSHVTPFAKDRAWREEHRDFLVTFEHVQDMRARRESRNAIAELSTASEIQLQRLISLGVMAKTVTMQTRPSAYARYSHSPQLVGSRGDVLTITAVGMAVLRFLGLLDPERLPEASHSKEWDAMDAEDSTGD
jgi:hypothetical protein